MRRIVTAVTAFLLLAATFLVLPVLTRSGPAPEPVPTSTDTVTLGSVTEPAADVSVQPGPTQPLAGAAATPTMVVTRTGVPSFSLVGLTWRADPQVTDTVVQVRVQDRAGAWGSWTAVTPETADQGAAEADTGARLRGGSSPLWTGPSTGVQVELTTRSGAQPTDVQLDLVDPGSSPADATLGTPAASSTAHAATTMPPVYSRAQWGADESIRTWDPQYAPTIKAATLHHSADTNDYTADQVPAMMRSIYRYHTVSLGWGDIGYNVIVDKFGRMWEGRYGGLSSTVIGAHAGGFNTSTFGVSMLGNYDVVPTTPAMIDAVASIIAWKFSLYGVDPNGTTTLTSGGGGTAKYAAGVKVTLPTIFGHRDVGSTLCPGRYGYAQLPAIRAKVTAILGSAVPLVQQRYDSDAAARSLLGAVTSPAQKTPDGSGAYAHYARGSIYGSPATGARIVRGAVRDKWAALGWERSWLGWPVTDTTATPDGKGLYQHFQNGSVYWSAATGAHTVSGAVRDAWGAAGWEGGALGYPIADQGSTPDGRAQYLYFQGGALYWSQQTGAHRLSGGVLDAWAAGGWEKGVLGLPVTDVASTPDGVGRYAHFQNGSLYWTAQTGGHVLRGAIRDAWAAAGWEGGPLGYPVTDVTSTPDGAAQYAHFQHGSVYWSQATGAHALSGAVLTAWAAAGWERGPLGLPVADTGATPDGLATYGHFQNGSIYSTADGARVVPPSVLAVWAASGWERGPFGYPVADAVTTTVADGSTAGVRAVSQRFQSGVLYAAAGGGHGVPTAIQAAVTAAAATVPVGLPVSDAGTTPDRAATYQHFAGGSVYVTAAGGARVVPTLIRTAWAASGWERGPLGYPTGDTVVTGNGASQSQAFQHGQVLWTRATGLRVLTGPVGDAWTAAGGRTGTLGFPTTDVVTTPDGVGAYAYFQGGAVYWSPTTGAHVIRGAALTAWEKSGWERGPLGYPTSDTRNVTGGTQTDFQHGSISVSAPSGEATVTVR